MLNDNLLITEDEVEKYLIELALNKLDNPFKTLSVKDVAKDLQIGKNAAYQIFKRDDFPSINLGQAWHVTLISYVVWKMQRRV